MIGGGYMGVRPHHRSHAAIEKPAHRLLFAGCFGVQVHEDKAVCAHLFDGFVHRAKRVIVVGAHERAADDVDHGEIANFSDSVSRRAWRIVQRSRDSARGVQVLVHVPVLEGVVAAGNDIDPAVK